MEEPSRHLFVIVQSLNVSNSLRSLACNTPGFPVHQKFPEFTQIHVHGVSDAIQPSHPLLSPSPPAFNLSSIRVFSNESVISIRWPKYWSLSLNFSPSKEYSGLISFGIDWFDFLAVQRTLKNILQFHSSKYPRTSSKVQ